jgi:prefoldin subunit 5
MYKLNIFFDQLKRISFWGRIFKWASLRSLSHEALQELTSLNNSHAKISDELSEVKNEKNLLEQKVTTLKAQEGDLNISIARVNAQVEAEKNKVTELAERLAAANKTISKAISDREREMEDYQKSIDKLNNAQTSLDNEKTRVNDARVKEKELELEEMKRTWQTHEIAVAQEMKRLCLKHTVTYLDSVPFKGAPDNPVEICDEIIIFDAKSPSNNDLNNFPKYIKLQAENAKKYTKNAGVKKEIYLVVPSNTVKVIPSFHYDMGEYDVYVITVDALEPVLLSLKKIEQYEFADKLSPDERSAICRVLGKYAHATKRRIQIDQYMSNHMLGLLKYAENSLPEDFHESVIQFEKAEKLNPTQEKRSKEISTAKLNDDFTKINKDAVIHDEDFPKKLGEMEL